MAVGASRPTVVADKDGFFGIRNEMLVSLFSYPYFVLGIPKLWSVTVV